MLEPTWNLTAARVPRAGTVRARTKSVSPDLNWLFCAGPYAMAVLWMGVMFTAVLYYAATGHREPLDWCRSDAVLTGTGTLVTLAALAATVRGWS